MDKVVCIIACRSKSTRLPGKAYLPFGDSSIIAHIVKQAQSAKLVDEVWAAVPYNDQQLLRFLAKEEINVFTGSEDDPLERMAYCASATEATHVVRITQDCPLLTPKIIDETINIHLRSDSDYTANRLFNPKYPDGFDVEIFKSLFLEKSMEINMFEEGDKEHVTPWIKRNASKVNAVFCPPELLPWQDIKLSVDTQEDYERVVKFYKEISCKLSWT
jgi:spore coat polysaccharide biosynthesis protein SpsF